MLKGLLPLLAEKIESLERYWGVIIYRAIGSLKHKDLTIDTFHIIILVAAILTILLVVNWIIEYKSILKVIYGILIAIFLIIILFIPEDSLTGFYKINKLEDKNIPKYFDNRSIYYNNDISKQLKLISGIGYYGQGLNALGIARKERLSLKYLAANQHYAEAIRLLELATISPESTVLAKRSLDEAI
jgi:hypothetical protein